MPASQQPATAKTQRRRKAPTLREHDWEPLKARIVDLHVKQNLALPEVKILMAKEYGFEATLRQYRSRISQWGLDKNVKSKEMDFIARKYHKRRKVTPFKSAYAFRVRGKPVPPAKIRRWIDRTNTQQIDSQEYDAVTPSDVSYWSELEEPTQETSAPMPHPIETGTAAPNSSATTSADRTAQELGDVLVRNRLASLVRYRQSSAGDSPVSSLQELYHKHDLPSLLGSLEIDDVLVAPYVANPGGGAMVSSKGPGLVSAGLDPPPARTLTELQAEQSNEEKKYDGMLDTFVQLFFEHAYPFVPVLDKQDFLRRWRNDRESLPFATRSAVFCLAEALNDKTESSLKWLRLASAQLSPSASPPNIGTLQSLLLLIKAKEYIKEDSYHYDSWLEISRCIELAEDLHLRQHTTHYAHPAACKVSAPQCRLMRQIWQTIYVIEVMISYPNAYSALTVPVESVDFSLGLDKTRVGSATEETIQFTQLARLVRDIKGIYSTYLVGKNDPSLVTETDFRRHKSTLESWINNLPANLRIEYPSDGSRPILKSAFAGHLHSFYCLGVIMLNRVQLPRFEKDSTNPRWLTYMLECHAAAKDQCRLHEAIVVQYGLRGVQCMQRGANFTIYCMLLCVVVHLAAVTSSDPRLHTEAPDFLSRQIQLLENCQKLWPSPELASQIVKLRDLLSSGVLRSAGGKEAPWLEETVAATHAQAFMSNWLGPEETDWNDVNFWIDSFL
ncbi:hypothetical protein NLG97_g1666 [Lecanicillium saksenae]|uniref:Uncharacterized protein n=1 Tax=Lecanicillium saksenae TaxID=468837 RepID=A0ACC1R4T5_9HYPO|nr:hypothetical protein NLG97_g1666 [Lecanicillium saksenae]